MIVNPHLKFKTFSNIIVIRYNENVWKLSKFRLERIDFLIRWPYYLAIWTDKGALSRVVHVVLLVRRLRPEGGLADVAVYHKAPIVHLGEINTDII